MIIYKVQNKTNGKCYIGQTINCLKQRKQCHIRDVNKGSKYRFHYAIRKYGIENFDWSILEICNSGKLDEREQYYVEKYNTYKKGYNMTLGGDNPMNIPELRKKMSESKEGFVVAEETKEKIRAALVGRKNTEHSKRMKGYNNPSSKKMADDITNRNNI